MKRIIINSLIMTILGFVITFLLRFAYGYYTYPDGERAIQQLSENSPSFDFERKNYASTKYSIKEGGATQGTYTVDQKYEKIASLSSQSAEFEKDEAKIRKSIKNYNAIIQFEQKSGMSGRRFLNLAIGVPPANFDMMVESIKKIGNLTAISIDKKDKTDDYKKLNVQKISLEKTHQALIELKKQGGKIAELINLENKILETENKIQDLGVNLGEFDSKNEFCTVKFTLTENKRLIADIPWPTRIKTALEWTIKYYSLFLFMLGIGVVIGLAGVRIFKEAGLKSYWDKLD